MRAAHGRQNRNRSRRPRQDGRIRAAAQRRESVIPAANRMQAIGLCALPWRSFGARHGGQISRHEAHLPTVQIVWARFLGQFLVMLSLLSALPPSALLRTRKLKLELLRSLLMVSTTTCNFLALRHLRLDHRRCRWRSRPADRGAAGRALPRRVGRLAPARRIFAGFVGVLIVVLWASAACTRPSPSPLAACSPTRSSCC